MQFHCVIEIDFSSGEEKAFSQVRLYQDAVRVEYRQGTYLQAVSQKRQTVLAKLELPHFIETAFVHKQHCRLLCQVQESVRRKMR